MSTARTLRLAARRPWITIAAGILFVAVFVARLIIQPSEQGVLLFFAIPIALIAMEFGLVGGLVAAGLASGLTGLYGIFETTEISALGYAIRIVAFVSIGAVTGALAVRRRAAARAQDAAESRLAAESVSLEAERLKAAIIDAALDCLITIDYRGVVVDFNRAAEDTFGYTAEEAIGRELSELIVPPELRERHRTALDRRVRMDKGSLLNRRVRFDAMRKDGSRLPVEVAVTRVAGADPPIFAGYIRDIGDVKRSEERALKQSRAIAALAEARGELVSQLMAAEERTRRRIAETLHDDALQRLLAAHQDLLEAAPGRVGVTRAQHALEGTIESLREAVAVLHPVTLQQGDLPTALTAIARQQAARGGFRQTVRVEADAVGLEDELVLSLARELLTNVAKHARASRCSVSVVREGSRVHLEVADDGVGIPPGRQEVALREGHIGLASAIQRMKAIGGEGEVASTPGKGTLVRAYIPIRQTKPAQTRRA